jgi:hypothetical protein
MVVSELCQSFLQRSVRGRAGLLAVLARQFGKHALDLVDARFARRRFVHDLQYGRLRRVQAQQRPTIPHHTNRAPIEKERTLVWRAACPATSLTGTHGRSPAEPLVR